MALTASQCWANSADAASKPKLPAQLTGATGASVLLLAWLQCRKWYC